MIAEDREEIFHNPTTLRIFLYLRSLTEADVGVRETQRALNLNSPSTASWHLEKLMNVGFVEKLPSNRYYLTSSGKTYQDFEIPLIVSVKLVRGILIPKFIFLIVFLLLDILFTIYIWLLVRDPLLIGINGAMSLLLALVIVVYFWITFNRQVSILYT